jgi:hypothetical protein
MLNLLSNRIRTLSAGSFDGLNRSTSLYLLFNDIRSIEAKTFMGLASIRELDLQSCYF